MRAVAVSPWDGRSSGSGGTRSNRPVFGACMPPPCKISAPYNMSTDKYSSFADRRSVARSRRQPPFGLSIDKSQIDYDPILHSVSVQPYVKSEKRSAPTPARHDLLGRHGSCNSQYGAEQLTGYPADPVRPSQETQTRGLREARGSRPRAAVDCFPLSTEDAKTLAYTSLCARRITALASRQETFRSRAPVAGNSSGESTTWAATVSKDVGAHVAATSVKAKSPKRRNADVAEQATSPARLQDVPQVGPVPSAPCSGSLSPSSAVKECVAGEETCPSAPETAVGMGSSDRPDSCTGQEKRTLKARRLSGVFERAAGQHKQAGESALSDAELRGWDDEDMLRHMFIQLL